MSRQAKDQKSCGGQEKTRGHDPREELSTGGSEREMGGGGDGTYTARVASERKKQKPEELKKVLGLWIWGGKDELKEPEREQNPAHKTPKHGIRGQRTNLTELSTTRRSHDNNCA